MSRSIYDQMLGHLRWSAPLEGVGLLAVTLNAHHEAQAVRFYPGTNVDASPTRYTMDPEEVLATIRDIERHGWRLGAIVHSHPETPAIPSATDRREAYYPEALLVIVGIASGEVRGWRIDVASPGRATTVEEVPLFVGSGG
jgi:proteasome lid subunit RPN8/RPN11